ncbi:MAG: PKD domain-containing protein, partial [bacterium]
DLLVGAPGANGNSGKVYLFNGATGAPITTFSNPTPTAGEQFGFAVAAVGNNVLIGAPLNNTGAPGAGIAYLFDATGTFIRTFANPTPTPSTGILDQFGSSVAAVGSNVLIGALGDDTGAINAGAAYLFDVNITLPIRTFTNPSPTLSDQFGGAVAGVGANVLIGSAFEDNPTTNSGVAYLFDVNMGPPIRTFLNPTPGNTDLFSFSVAAFGNSVLAVIGAPLDDAGASNAGASYLYDVTVTSPLQTFLNPAPVANDQFGFAIAAGGNNIIIAARNSDVGGFTDAGTVYLFSSNAPPVADAGADQTVECTSPSGTLVTLDGSGSNDPNNDQLTYTWRENGIIIAGPIISATSQVTLALGSHTIELTVEDGKGGTDTDVVVINVVDTTPPVTTLQPPIALWPPNHKYTTISIAQIVVSVNDACAGSIPVSEVKIASVSSDEPEDTPDVVCLIDDPLHVCFNGDGSTTDDIVIAGDCQSVQLRKERAASGNGRVYTINLKVSDANGNGATAAFKVSVPHDQGSGSVAVENVPYYTVNSNCAGSSAKVAGNNGREVGDMIAAPFLPDGYAVFQNYPNPFNPETQIRFALPEASHVVVKIFSMLGENIRTLADGEFAAGTHAVRWNAQNERGEKVPSGVYFYQLVTPGFTETKRMILAK